MFYNGRAEDVESRQVPLVDAFHILWHSLEFRSNGKFLEHATDTEIQFSLYPTKNMWTTFWINRGQPTREQVVAEKETINFSGSPECIKPLREYLNYVLHNNTNFSKPSLIPCLLMSTCFAGWFSDKDKKTMAYFGFTGEDCDHLRNRSKTKRGNWLDVATINELWFEHPDRSLSDLLTEYLD